MTKLEFCIEIIFSCYLFVLSFFVLRWYADGDGGQCGGGSPTQMCAKMGPYTPYYRDDTDRRGGGCRMSWRIKVK